MQRKATHKVSFYGVRCYNDDRTGELWGCNWFWEQLIMLAVLFHWMIAYCTHTENEGFPLVVIEEYKD